MTVTINGTTGISSDAGYSSDGVSFADGTPSNTLVTTTGGNVGIGTSSNISGVKFQVKNTTNANFCVGSQYLGYLNDAGSSWANTSLNGLNVIFGVGQYAVEAARIDSSGRLLVGTTTANPGNGNNSIGTAMQGSTGFYGCREPANYCVYLNSTALDGSNRANYISFGLYGTNNIGAIHANGLATVYATSSDYRLKENVAPLSGSLDKVMQLKPCKWKWKDLDSETDGFIAHELAEVCPNAVSGEKDAVDEDGKPVYQSVDTSFLVATLTASIQEQQALIEQLRADVEALKGQQA